MLDWALVAVRKAKEGERTGWNAISEHIGYHLTTTELFINLTTPEISFLKCVCIQFSSAVIQISRPRLPLATPEAPKHQPFRACPDHKQLSGVWINTFTILTGLMLMLHLVCPLRNGGSSSTRSISISSSVEDLVMEETLPCSITSI